MAHDYSTWWYIYKIVFPLIFLFIVLANLPAIIGIILMVPMWIVLFPFIMAYAVLNDVYLGRKAKRAQQSYKDYYKEYKPDKEPEYQYDRYSELYSLLGVRPNATKAEMKSAFKSKMMMNHPDKLSTLDPELQRMAMERTIAIKDAYERLSGVGA